VRVAGVDGCRGGWLIVSLSDGSFERAEVVPTFRAALALVPDAAVFGVDIPIGLSDDSPRSADKEARRYVAQRASTVFLTPPRSVLEAVDHGEANRRMRELTGGGISRQTFALARRILEVEPFALEDERVFEVHPEVSFAAMAGESLTHSKHSWSGFHLRRRLLESQGIELPDDLPQTPVLDVLDAAAAAWSAARIAVGDAESLPAAHDRIGAIWY
jgi:predicted RNase H-like nuclease